MQQLGAYGGEVNGIADFSLGQVIGNLFGNGDGYVDLGFIGRDAQVGGADYILQGDELFVLGRFFIKTSSAAPATFPETMAS